MASSERVIGKGSSVVVVVLDVVVLLALGLVFLVVDVCFLLDPLNPLSLSVGAVFFVELTQ